MQSNYDRRFVCQNWVFFALLHGAADVQCTIVFKRNLFLMQFNHLRRPFNVLPYYEDYKGWNGALVQFWLNTFPDATNNSRVRQHEVNLSLLDEKAGALAIGSCLLH